MFFILNKIIKSFALVFTLLIVSCSSDKFEGEWDNPFSPYGTMKIEKYIKDKTFTYSISTQDGGNCSAHSFFLMGDNSIEIFYYDGVLIATKVNENEMKIIKKDSIPIAAFESSAYEKNTLANGLSSKRIEEK